MKVEPEADVAEEGSYTVQDMVKVVFTPSGRRGSFPVNTPLLHAARVLGVDIDSVCGGRGLCGRCQIVCAEGSFAKHQIESHSSHLSPVCATEIKYGERKTPLANGRRLSCHTLLLDDVVIDVPPESQVHRQIVRKEAEYRDIESRPGDPPLLCAGRRTGYACAQGDLQRLIETLEQDWQLPNLGCDSDC